MATATRLVSSLFNVTSSGDVPFHQLQQLQYLHHFSTKAHLFSPLYSIPFSLYHVDEALKYTRFAFGVTLKQVQCKKGCFLRYSLFGMLAKCLKSWKKNEA